jgi:hypothetical protein
VKIKEYGTDEPYTDEVTLEIGKEYEVYTYYHNNAKSRLNTLANGEIGIAKGVRILPGILFIVWRWIS